MELRVRIEETPAGVPVVRLCGDIDLHPCTALRATERLLREGVVHLARVTPFVRRALVLTRLLPFFTEHETAGGRGSGRPRCGGRGAPAMRELERQVRELEAMAARLVAAAAGGTAWVRTHTPLQECVVTSTTE